MTLFHSRRERVSFQNAPFTFSIWNKLCALIVALEQFIKRPVEVKVGMQGSLHATTSAVLPTLSEHSLRSVVASIRFYTITSFGIVFGISHIFVILALAYRHGICFLFGVIRARAKRSASSRCTLVSSQPQRS